MSTGTIQQNLATSPALLLRASAGTGKTFQLSNRILWLVLQGESPQRILAATFARKAAAEILERVLSRLAAATESSRCAAQLGAEVGVPGLSLERCQESLLRLVQTQHFLSICTLDSFCVRVAKLFSRELGLYQDWRLLEGEREEASLLEEALAHFFSSADAAQVQPLLAIVQQGRCPRSVRGVFTGKLMPLLRQALEVPAAAQNFLVLGAEPDAEQRALLQQQLVQLTLPTTKTGTVNKNWLNEQQRLLRCLEAQNWAELIRIGLPAKVLGGETSFQKTELSEGVTAFCRTLLESARSVLLRAREQQTRAALALLRQFGASLGEQRQQLQAFGFSDIKQLLSAGALSQNIDHLYYRLDSSVRHILLDEFQDTSPLEWRVLLPLIEEILSQSSQERSFFCVGDAKQAIYQWRGGTSEIFDQLPQRWPQLMQHTMACSYRSAPAIMQFVNHIFLAIADNSALQENSAALVGDCAPRAVALRWARAFSEHQSAFPERAGYVEIYSFEKIEPAGHAEQEEAEDSEDSTQEQASEQRVPASAQIVLAAQCVADLHARFPAASIGVLLRSNAQVSSIHSQLANLGLRASAEGASSLLDSAGVQALLSLAQLLQHPTDSIARFHVSKALVGTLLVHDPLGVGASAQELAQLRERCAERGVGSCFAALAEQSARTAAPAEASVLRQFSRAALSYRGETGDFSGFVCWMEESGLASDRLLVRCMTIHKSKGLEFDFVVLPELSEDLLRDKDRPFFLIDRDPLDARVKRILCMPTSNEIALDPQLTQIKQKLVAERIFDGISLLYVALTRARCGLHILLPAQDRAKLSASQLIRARLGALTPAQPPAALAGLVQECWLFGEKQRSEQQMLQAARSVRVENSSTRPAVPVPKIVPAKRPRVLPRVSPSSLEGSAQGRTLAELLHAVPRAALERGAQLHQRLSQIEWLPSQASSQILGELELSPHIRALFMPERYPTPVKALWRERSFCVEDGQQLLVGAFDRVVLWEQPSIDGSATELWAEIIDFKSDSFAGAGDKEQQLTARVDFYSPQMKAYQKALGLMLGLELSRIRVSLGFVCAGIVWTLKE